MAINKIDKFIAKVNKIKQHIIHIIYKRIYHIKIITNIDPN